MPQEGTRAIQVGQVESVCTEALDKQCQETIDVEPALRHVGEVPVGLRVRVAARTRAVEHQQPETGLLRDPGNNGRRQDHGRIVSHPVRDACASVWPVGRS